MLNIDATQLLDDLKSLWQIGATPDGGVTRSAMSEADVAGRVWFRQRVTATGLDFREDGAGNQYATLRCANPDAKTLLCGSHLDTVPNGGRYDGSLGTLSALAAVEAIQKAGLTLPVHLEVVNFTDEEGAMMGLFGSQAVAGMLTAESFVNPRGGVAALTEGMVRLGISAESTLAAKRDPSTLAGFVEIHIEQGTRLEKAGIDIGVVNAIVGIRSATVTFTGAAAHAGAQPMAERKDALWGAAAFVLHARELMMQKFHPGVCNIGAISAEPGAFNIVPAQATLSLEFRYGTEAQLDEMQGALEGLAHEIAAEFGLGFAWDGSVGCVAAPADERVIVAIEQSAEKLGLSHTRLLSFAGHDTQSMATITPSAMIFVPSVGGVSHNSAEYTKPQDCINGANVLLHTLLTLAG